MTNTTVSSNTAALLSVAGPKTSCGTLPSGFSGTHWSRLAAYISDPFLNYINSAVSVQCESSGFGQYLSVLEGTGASAGRRDRQDRHLTRGAVELRHQRPLPDHRSKAGPHEKI